MIVDPGKMEWVTLDPLGRTVSLPSALADARESVGKHRDDEYLSRDQARVVVESPDRIDISSSDPRRDVYYRTRGELERGPYERVVVQFENESTGTAISWSVYDKPVGSSGVRYWKGGVPWRFIG